MTGPARPEPASMRPAEETEVRNWMLPLEEQEFRVPSAERFTLPRERVEWSGRLFTMSRWFRRVAIGIVVLTVLVTAVRWMMAMLA